MSVSQQYREEGGTQRFRHRSTRRPRPTAPDTQQAEPLRPTFASCGYDAAAPQQECRRHGRGGAHIRWCVRAAQGKQSIVSRVHLQSQSSSPPASYLPACCVLPFHVRREASHGVWHKEGTLWQGKACRGALAAALCKERVPPACRGLSGASATPLACVAHPQDTLGKYYDCCLTLQPAVVSLRTVAHATSALTTDPSARRTEQHSILQATCSLRSHDDTSAHQCSLCTARCLAPCRPGHAQASCLHLARNSI